MLVLCKNCIFVHMTDKFFPVTGPIWRPLPPLAPKVQVLEPAHAWRVRSLSAWQLPTTQLIWVRPCPTDCRVVLQRLIDLNVVFVFPETVCRTHRLIVCLSNPPSLRATIYINRFWVWIGACQWTELKLNVVCYACLLRLQLMDCAFDDVYFVISYTIFGSPFDLFNTDTHGD